MDCFNFIETWINQLFTNTGLQTYFTYVIGIFGIYIIYRAVGGWIYNKWFY